MRVALRFPRTTIHSSICLRWAYRGAGCNLFSAALPSRRRYFTQDLLKTEDVTAAFYRGFDDRDYEPPSGWAGTFVLRDPNAITTAEIVAQLPDSGASFTISTVLVLASPQLAHLLDQDFISQSTARLCRKSLRSSAEQSIVRVVTAVVDRIPGPADHSKPGSTSSEGLSIFLSNSPMRQDDEHNRWPASSSNQDSEQLAILRFGSSVGKIKCSTIAGAGFKQGSHEIQLPLANTLFVNGRISSMYESFWERSKEEANEGLLPRLPPRPLKAFTVELPVKPEHAFNAWQSLQSVTTERKITAALGNVIREIEVDENKVPASSELEPAVNEIARSRASDANGKVIVYAMVWSDQIGDLAAAAVTRQIRFIEHYIGRGARLYRVTGGGGGWGSRKGLLSLDPVSSFEEPTLTTEAPIAEGESTLEDSEPPPALMTSVGECVKAGEMVKFFIYTGDDNSSTAITDAHRQYQAMGASSNYQMVLGSISPTEAGVDEHQEDTRTKNVQHVENVFGALSERGVGLVVRGKLGPKHGPVFLGDNPSVLLNSTRFDVPGVRFTSFVYDGKDVRGEYRRKMARKDARAKKPKEKEPKQSDSQDAKVSTRRTQQQTNSIITPESAPVGRPHLRTSRQIVFEAEVPGQDVILDVKPQPGRQDPRKGTFRGHTLVKRVEHQTRPAWES